MFYFLVASLVQYIFIYSYGPNFFTLIILGVVTSFFLNTTLPSTKSYHFFRHAIIYFFIYIMQTYLIAISLDLLNNFYTPTTLWKIVLLISVIFGVIHSFGKYNNGSKSKQIEQLGTLILSLLLIGGCFLFWWKGILAYVVARIILTLFEVWVSNFITGFIVYRYNRSNNEYIDI